MTVKLVYRGVLLTPKWRTVEDTLIEMLDQPGRLTRIMRPDGLCNYRTVGTYCLTFTPDTGDDVLVDMEVSRS